VQEPEAKFSGGPPPGTKADFPAENNEGRNKPSREETIMVTMTTANVRQDVSIQDLLEAGLHFGHRTKRWNPKMRKFLFGQRNGIYIIDLEQTLDGLQKARQFIYDTVSRGRQILFVGTKKQAQEALKSVAPA
jgi:ribosomal protein S2